MRRALKFEHLIGRDTQAFDLVELYNFRDNANEYESIATA